MNNIEDIRVTVYNDLNKKRNMEIHYLYEKLLRKYSIVDIEELVNQSILKAAYNYDSNDKASFLTYFKKILKNATLNYLRDKGKYNLSSIDEIFENEDGEIVNIKNLAKESTDKYFDAILEEEKNAKIEISKKHILIFLDSLEGLEKIITSEIVNIARGKENVNFQKIAKEYKMDKREIYKIKNNIEKRFTSYIKKLPKELRDSIREITFEPKPGEPTKFRNLLEKETDTPYTYIEDISILGKLINVIFSYQNDKFNYFFNNNISDDKLKTIYDQLK